MLFSNLSAFELYLLLGSVLWPLFLLVSVALAGLALALLHNGKPWLAGFCGIAFVVALLPVLYKGSLSWQDMQEQQRDARRAAHRWTLETAQTDFPAGSVLQLHGSYDMSQKHQA